MPERDYNLRATFSARDKTGRTFKNIETKIDKLEKKMSNLSGETAIVRVEDAGTIDDTDERLKQLERQHERLDGKKAELETKVKDKAAKRSIADLRKQAERGAEMRFDIDTSDFRRASAESKTLRSQVSRMFAKAQKLEFEADDADARRDAASLKAYLGSAFNDVQFDIDYINAHETNRKLDASKVKAERLEKDREFRVKQRGIDEMNRKMDDSRNKITALTDEPSIVEFDGDIKKFEKALSQVRSQLDKEIEKQRKIVVEAKGKGFTDVGDQAATLMRELQAIKDTKTIEINTKGIPQSLVGLATLQSYANKVDGRYVVDVDVSKAAKARMVMQSLGQSINSFKNYLQTARPLMVAFAQKVYVGQQAMFIFAKAIQLTALGAIGPLVGGLVIAVSALGAFAAGLGLVAVAAMPVIKALAGAKQNSEDLKGAQDSLKQSSEQLGQAQRSLGDAHKNAATVAKQGQEQIASAVKAHKDSLEGIKDAQRGVGQAEEELSRTRQDNARQIQEAIKAHKDALGGIKDAQRAVGEAERNLNQTRQENARKIQDAIAAHKEAVRGIKDAQREVGEAERSLHQTRMDNASRVQDAIAAHKDALQGIKDAQRDVTDARRSAQQTQEQVQRDINDAIKDERDAIEGVKDARYEVKQALYTQEQAYDTLQNSVEDYNRALKDEKYNLQDLKYEMEGMYLSRRELTLDLKEATEELREAENPDERARAQLRVERLKLREKQLTNDIRDGQQELNTAQREGTDELKSAIESRRQAGEELVESNKRVWAAQEDVVEAENKATEAARNTNRVREEGARSMQAANRDIADAQRGVREAQKEAAEAEANIADVRRENAERERQAIEEVRAAQRGVTEAKREAQEAEQNIAKVRQEAARAEKDALRDVREAQRGVTEAREAAREAEANIARTRQEAARREQDAMRAVMEAHRQVRDAREQEQEAERNIAEARQDAAEANSDAAERVADAQRAVAKAQRKVQEEQNKINEILSRTPGYMAPTIAAFNRFKTIGAEAFRPASKLIARMTTDAFNFGAKGLPALGNAALLTAQEMQTAFSNVNTIGKQARAAKSLREILAGIPRITGLWTEAIGLFGAGFANVMAVAMPYANDFSNYIRDAAEQFARWSGSEEGREALKRWFDAAVIVSAALWEELVKIGGAIAAWSIKHPEQVAAAIGAIGDVLEFIGRAIVKVIDFFAWFRTWPKWIQNTTIALGAAFIALRLFGPTLITMATLGGKAWSAVRLLGTALGITGGAAAIAGGKARTAGKGFGGFSTMVATGGRNANGAIVPMKNAGGAAAAAGNKAKPAGGKFASLGRLAKGAGLALGGLVGLTNPWLLAAVALSAAVVVLYKNHKGFRDWVNKLGTSLKENQGVMDLWKTVVDATKGAMRNLAKAAQWAWNLFGKFLNLFTPKNQSNIQAITTVIGGISKGVSGVIRVVGVINRTWKRVWGSILTKIGEAARGIGGWLSNIRGNSNDTKNKVATDTNAAGISWAGLSTKVGTETGKIYRNVNQWAKDVGERIRESNRGNRSSWDEFWNGASILWSESFAAIWRNAGRWDENMDTRLKNSNMGYLTTWGGFWKKAKEKWGTGFAAIWRNAGRWEENMNTRLENANMGYLTNWGDFWSEAQKKFKNGFAAIWRNAGRWKDNMHDRLSRGSEGHLTLWGAFWTDADELWGEGFADLWRNAGRWNENMNERLNNGSKENLGTWGNFWRSSKKMWGGGFVDLWRNAGTANENMEERLENGNERKLGAWGRFWKSAKKMFREGFKSVYDNAQEWGENIDKIFYDAVNNARRWLGWLAKGMGVVLYVIGMKETASVMDRHHDNLTTPIKQFAHGGTTTVEHGVVHEYGSGGIADGRMPHAVYGEVGKRESYTVHGRSDNLPYAEQYLNSVGHTAVPAYAEGGITGGLGGREEGGKYGDIKGRVHDGGAGAGQYGPTDNSLWNSDTFGRVIDVLKRYRVSANTYSNHPPAAPSNAGNSADFWDYAGRGVPISTNLAYQVRDYITGNLNEGLSWTLGEGDAGHTGGSRHVHATWQGAGPSTPNVGYSGGTGGGGVGRAFSGLKDWAGDRYNDVADFMSKKFKVPDIPDFGMGMFGNDLTTGLGNTLLDNATDWIRDLATERLKRGGGSEGGPGLSYSGGGTPQKNRDLGREMLQDTRWANQFSALDSLYTKESGWNQYADNPTSDAYGIPQGMMGPGGHSPPAGYMPPKSDPVVQIDWGLGYLAERYPSGPNQAWAKSQNVGWYGDGGIATSPQMAVLGEKGGNEAVIPLNDPNAVNMLSKSFGKAQRGEDIHNRVDKRVQGTGDNSSEVREELEKVGDKIVDTLREELQEIGLDQKTVDKLVGLGFNSAIELLRSRLGEDLVEDAIGNKAQFYRELSDE